MRQPLTINKNVILTPAALMQRMIKVSQGLIALAEKETQALLVQDMLAFSILQYEKEKMAEDYARHSEEFRNRIEEFRGIDRGLLNHLEALQKDLGRVARDNNMLVEQIGRRAERKLVDGIRENKTIADTRHVVFTDTATGESAQGAAA